MIGRYHTPLRLACTLLLLCSPLRAQEATPATTVPVPANYVIGPHDVLNISVWDQNDISGKYTVEQDGTFSFPLLGRVAATGLTLRELETALTRRLADGLFRDPQVTIAVIEYRSRRVFVVGEVRQPGTHTLNGEVSVIEVLARAGSTNAAAADHVLVVRPVNGGGPVLPGQDQTAEVIRVELRDLEGGALAKNVSLRDGDTLFVPRAAVVYVTGRVRNPGSYPLAAGMTVLQALSLAGGPTDFGATNRIRVRRGTGTGREFKAELTTPIEPGDTVVVPERFF